MYQLKEKLWKYTSEEELLKSFRNGMANELKLLEIHLKSIEEDLRKYNNTLNEEEILAKIEEHRFECDRGTFDEILPILNGIHISIDGLPKYPMKVYISEEYQETIFVYDYYDFIKIFDEVDDYMYFVAMVYIAQNAEKSDLLSSIAIRVKSVLRQLNIRIPNYGKSVFVAMSFNEELREVRQTICTVIEDNGFKSVVIDSKEHNNQIVPEIFYEIDKADFVIADLTDHKAGVYYEAGYANGMGKPVIFTCRKADFNNRHFDVAQTNTIVWESESELRRRLNARIEAMYLIEETEITETVPW